MEATEIFYNFDKYTELDCGSEMYVEFFEELNKTLELNLDYTVDGNIVLIKN